VQEQKNIKERRPGGSGPRHAAVNPLQKMGDYLSHNSLSSLLSCPPGSVVTESLEGPGEQEVGGEAVHAREDEVANQVDNTLSFCL
jgi:hypothetical protein